MAKGKPGQSKKGVNPMVGRIVQGVKASAPARGSPVQGEKQHLKGGPSGAMQGGASRGGSRVEPSHTKEAAKKGGAKKKK